VRDYLKGVYSTSWKASFISFGKRKKEGRRGCFCLKEVEKIGELFSNHALESDDKEESECASPMIITIYILQSIIVIIIIPTTSSTSTTFHRKFQLILVLSYSCPLPFSLSFFFFSSKVKHSSSSSKLYCTPQLKKIKCMYICTYQKML